MAERVIEIYSDTRSVGKCTGPNCGKKILWAEVVKSGKRMPFSDPEAVALSTRGERATGRVIEAIPFELNHWNDCPDARRFK
jgi:hypothetical protein